MSTTKRISIWLMMILLLTACGSSAGSIETAIAQTKIAMPTATEIPTSTATLTVIPTSTATNTPEPTSTPTLAPTPDPCPIVETTEYYQEMVYKIVEAEDQFDIMLDAAGDDKKFSEAVGTIALNKILLEKLTPTTCAEDLHASAIVYLEKMVVVATDAMIDANDLDVAHATELVAAKQAFIMAVEAFQKETGIK